jgi:hypothetical protein
MCACSASRRLETTRHPLALDAVALVGVVGVAKCHESMETLLGGSASSWPLLRMMHEASRFVFFYGFAASPRARVAVLGAEAGHGVESAAVGGAGAGSPRHLEGKSV